jgi:hypothetical protein
MKTRKHKTATKKCIVCYCPKGDFYSYLWSNQFLERQTLLINILKVIDSIYNFTAFSTSMGEIGIKFWISESFTNLKICTAYGKVILCEFRLIICTDERPQPLLEFQLKLCKILRRIYIEIYNQFLKLYKFLLNFKDIYFKLQNNIK